MFVLQDDGAAFLRLDRKMVRDDVIMIAKDGIHSVTGFRMPASRY